jgi:hypothetical protein
MIKQIHPNTKAMRKARELVYNINKNKREYKEWRDEHDARFLEELRETNEMGRIIFMPQKDRVIRKVLSFFGFKND